MGRTDASKDKPHIQLVHCHIDRKPHRYMIKGNNAQDRAVM